MMAKTEVNAVDQTTLRTAGLGRGWAERCAALVLDASVEEQERARSIKLIQPNEKTEGVG